MSNAGWFWSAVLFYIPAASIAGWGWATRRQGAPDRRDSVRSWSLAAQAVLATTVLAAGLVAISLARNREFVAASMAFGIVALVAASWWLLLVRPRRAAFTLAATALVLPAAATLTAPLFVVDPNEVPPGPNPATAFMFTALLVVGYCLPALIASVLALKAEPRLVLGS